MAHGLRICPRQFSPVGYLHTIRRSRLRMATSLSDNCQAGLLRSSQWWTRGFSKLFTAFRRTISRRCERTPPRHRPAAGPQVVYNLIGPNARVNIQSSDSSTNVVSVESAVLFDDLRETIRESSLDSTVEQQLIQNVEAMQSAVGTKKFAEHYGEFIAAAADHMTLVAPFLPALAQMLL